MLSRFFIHRPIFATVISIVILIAGMVSQRVLPIAKFPEIAPPTVQVTAFYPGANAEVVSETVAAPVEQEVNGVEDMLYMSSVCSADGAYTLTVTFAVGTDMNMAQVLVQNRVARAEPKLPEDVRRQGITTKKKSTQIVQFITVYADNENQERYNDLYLSNFATIRLKDELARLNGVGEVMIFGVSDYSMRIWLNPNQLKARNLTTEDVVAAVREQNVQVAAGKVGAPPTPDSTAFELTINTLGRLRDVEQFQELIVKTGEDGRVTRVKDVARVELGAKDYKYSSTFSRMPTGEEDSSGAVSTDESFTSKPCAAVAIYQLPGANALDVATAVEKKMAELSPTFPEGVVYSIPFDTTRFVTASIEEVYTTLFMAVGLVVLVIFIFLQDWRATLIPCAAIPVSLIGTFAFMAALGFSLNMLTLFGIVLAIGIVVDDAIVVVENTSRHLDAGMASKDAAVQAMLEITGPVIATTLVLLAVFVPTAFMGGITGQLYRQFALTISGAVIISTINALTLSPALCGLLLRPSTSGGAKNFFLFRGFNRGFDSATSGYRWIIGGMVRRIALVMIVFAGLVVLTGWSFGQIPTGFMPIEDQGYVFANVQLPDAASLPRTRRVMAELDEILKETPGVASTVSVSGYSMLTGSSGSNVGMIFTIFHPWEERTSRETSLRGIMTNLRQEFYGVEDAVAFAFVPPAIDGLGVAGGFQMQLQDRGDVGLGALQAAAEDLVQTGSSQTGLAGLNTTFRANTPQLFVDVDRTKVKSLDVPLDLVYDTLQAELGSTYVNDFNRFGRTYQVMIQADEEFRVQAENILELDVRNRRGEMVPIGAVATVDESFGPQLIQRYNLYPSAQINGEPAPGYSSGQALLLMEQMADANLPTTMGFEWTGMSYQEKLISDSTNITQSPSFILAMSVVFVFLVLSAQYESWTAPAAVISVVPLAALGVVIALMLAGADNNTYTQIGIVLLVALASKNAILIVEFAREQRSQVSIREAAVSAAGLRFRAILMTAFSSILGFLPLLLASGAGAASRVAVGLAVVGGMTAATFFCLLFVPSFFVLFQSISEWLSGEGNATANTD